MNKIEYESIHEEGIKVYIDENICIQIKVTLSTLAEDICDRINEKYKAPNGDENLQRYLYVRLGESKKPSLGNRLLRQLNPKERMLEVHISLNAKKSSHEFLALFPLELIEPEEPKNPFKSLPDKMFKDGIF